MIFKIIFKESLNLFKGVEEVQKYSIMYIYLYAYIDLLVRVEKYLNIY